MTHDIGREGSILENEIVWNVIASRLMVNIRDLPIEKKNCFPLR